MSGASFLPYYVDRNYTHDAVIVLCLSVPHYQIHSTLTRVKSNPL